jgi:hypothetical protein
MTKLEKIYLKNEKKKKPTPEMKTFCTAPHILNVIVSILDAGCCWCGGTPKRKNPELRRKESNSSSCRKFLCNKNGENEENEFPS